MVGKRECRRRGIAAFEEIPTSGHSHPAANSRTVDDDDVDDDYEVAAGDPSDE